MIDRPIKFRAWDKEDKRMIYDIQDRSKSECDFITGPNHFNYFLSHGGFDVMQYTGLHDKNGNEIYEGDIVKYRSYSFKDYLAGKDMLWHQHHVIWNEGGCCWYVGDEDNGFRPTKQTDDNNFEVIGNIYENPELLK